MNTILYEVAWVDEEGDGHNVIFPQDGEALRKFKDSLYDQCVVYRVYEVTKREL